MNSPTRDIPLHARYDDELVTLDDVAEILQAPVNTVRLVAPRGTGPDFLKIGRRLYTTVGDLRTFIRMQRPEGAAAFADGASRAGLRRSRRTR
ncbi:hypothetical protein [Calidifontibacter indicus]|uniref:Helix-turn-helix protein n=1 Tax=Calidifontibacter indicus TaxID=419650 RepID=A0A3D9UR94_9MICO|nr:hypothetical protein [Calidifontibacter indicus]REF30510.1 hypothetical protein DFJ65_1518 [Calidifontibacter indicus]